MIINKKFSSREMCIYAFALNIHENYKFVLVGNRDEYYNRGSKNAHFWDSNPSILGGIDEQEGGTWLGITKMGKIAFITNFRNPKLFDKSKKSRGNIVKKFLSENFTLKDFSKTLKNEFSLYNGFNLVFGTTENLFYASNISKDIKKLPEGIHSVSNAFLDSDWPKCIKLKDSLNLLLSKNRLDENSVFQILEDTEKAEDCQLPDTGINYRLEKMLSSVFIKSEHYGTVFSYFITIDYDNNVKFIEKNQLTNEIQRFEFKLQIQAG